MRRHALISSFLIGCGIFSLSAASLATTTKEEVNIENVKAPPRDIKDILRLVEQTKPDLAIVERAKKIVASPLPASQDNEVLNHFYTRRSAAFEDLGNTTEALKNLEIAVNKYPVSYTHLTLPTKRIV